MTTAFDNIKHYMRHRSSSLSKRAPLVAVPASSGSLFAFSIIVSIMISLITLLGTTKFDSCLGVVKKVESYFLPLVSSNLVSFVWLEKRANLTEKP